MLPATCDGHACASLQSGVPLSPRPLALPVGCDVTCSCLVAIAMPTIPTSHPSSPSRRPPFSCSTRWLEAYYSTARQERCSEVGCVCSAAPENGGRRLEAINTSAAMARIPYGSRMLRTGAGAIRSGGRRRRLQEPGQVPDTPRGYISALRGGNSTSMLGGVWPPLPYPALTDVCLAYQSQRLHTTLAHADSYRC